MEGYNSLYTHYHLHKTPLKCYKDPLISDLKISYV